MKWIFFSLLFIISSTFASEKVAKVIILKGDVVSYKQSDEKGHSLKRGDWVEEGAVVKCGPRSFAKLLFIDKSQINISANSEMLIKEFPRQKAGIINLLKGKVRAKVTKNYMEINPKNSKLFIKTKTAAMGVRGTDFQVIFNPRNDVTSLLTFEGAVAMAKLNGEAARNQAGLERILNRRDAVMVKAGQFSGANPGDRRVTIPVKISPAQLESLKSSNGSSSKAKEKTPSESKVVRSAVPKGLDAKKLAAVNQENIENTLGVKGDDVRVDNSGNPPAEGFVNKDTGAVAPPSGGFIDQKTGLYVPPVEGSTYDPNAGVYIPPPEMGSVDLDTGDYVPPSGYELTDAGDLSQVSSDGRGPASVSGGSKINVKDAASQGLKGADKNIFNPLTKEPQILRNFQQETLQDFNNPTLQNRIAPQPRVRIRLRR